MTENTCDHCGTNVGDESLNRVQDFTDRICDECWNKFLAGPSASDSLLVKQAAGIGMAETLIQNGLTEHAKNLLIEIVKESKLSRESER